MGGKEEVCCNALRGPSPGKLTFFWNFNNSLTEEGQQGKVEAEQKGNMKDDTLLLELDNAATAQSKSTSARVSRVG